MTGQADQPQPKGQGGGLDGKKQPRSVPFGPLGWLLLALALLVLPFNRGGLWDPYELRFAELGRRLAHQMWGARAMLGAAEPLGFITAQHIGQGELAATSPALGFALFGVSAWAGRVTSLFWGLLTVLGLWIMMGRLACRLAQRLSVILLVTLPIFVWQSRSMLGDAPTIATSMLALAGLTLLRFDSAPSVNGRHWHWRLLFAVMAAVGLGAGILCRGVLTGVAVPCLSVALVALAQRRRETPTRSEQAMTIALLVMGVSASWFGIRETVNAPNGFSFLLGVTLGTKTQGSPFDVSFTNALHQLFPLSTLMPVAAALALRPTRNWRARTSPETERDPAVVEKRDPAAVEKPSGNATVAAGSPATEARTATQDSIIAGVGVCAALFSLVVASMLARRAVAYPFPALGALAAVAGVAVAPWHRRGENSALAAGVVATMGILLFSDYINIPTKIAETAGVMGARYPDSFELEHRFWLRTALSALVIGCTLAAMSDRRSTGAARAFRAQWRHLFDRLRSALGGQLMSGFVLVETALVTTALLQRAHDHGWITVPAFDSARLLFGPVLSWLWIAPPCVLFVGPFGYVTLSWFVDWLVRPGWGPSRFGSLVFAGIDRRVRAEALERLRLSPAMLLTAALVASGLLIGVGHGSALSEQLSPKRAIRQYLTHAAPGEAVGLLGIKAESVAYDLGARPEVFFDIETGAKWLEAAGAERRWLAFGADHLAELNGAYRAVSKARNLMLIDPPSSNVLLATNRLIGSERDFNPLSSDLRANRPATAHDASIEFGGGVVTLVGWDIEDGTGASQSRLVAGLRYELRLVFEVQGTTNTEWQIFVHIDGQGRRHNGDHDPIRGRYPTTLWQPGDVLIDRHEVILDRSAIPGPHTLYFGLFRGNKRFDVTRGSHEDNRVKLGDLEVLSAR